MKRFNIFPEKGKDQYYRCFVFKTEKELREAYGKYGCSELFSAATISFRAYSGEKVLNVVGDIVFWEKEVSPEIVSHEITHAVNHYFNRFVGKGRWREQDEQYATAVGYMVKQFYKKYE